MEAQQSDVAPLRVGARDQDLSARLAQELIAFNVRATGAGDQQGLSVRVTGAGGELIAGLAGWTWGDCSGIASLWVHEQHRREGWGSRLVQAAQDEARRRGCTQMNVSSLTFQAPDFYRRHGFIETGRTQGIPGGHADVHFWKRLEGVPVDSPRL